MNRKTKILISGTCGFIFSNFIRKALYEKSNYDIVSFDKVLNSSLLNNIYVHKSHEFYMGSCEDSHFVDRLFEYVQPDIVIHSAALSSVDSSLSTGAEFVKTNVLGTQVMVDACVKYKSKLVFISTDECYGHLKNESEPSWTEDSPLNPRNPYSASKAAGELLVRAAGETHGLNYIITRSSNNYGPRQTADKFIPKVIKCILNNSTIPVYGKGEQIRDWLYVGDNCSAILKIMESGKNQEVYNISSNQEFSNIEVVYEICKIMGKGTDLITFVQDRPGHDFRYSINASKLRSLGWQPQVKFKQGGLEACVNWYVNNQWFLK